MADEVWGSGLDDINTWWQVREDTNKVTEEAVRRIQDNQKKAQQIGQDIKNDKATNGKYAKFLTFSKIKYFGIWFFIISHILKNKLPLLSVNPFWYPAFEKAWHGNPAHNMSKFGIFLISIFVISSNGLIL